MMRIRLVMLVLLGYFLSYGQGDSLYQYRMFQLQFDNDIFTGTDRYYSQGVFLKYEHYNGRFKWLKRFFFRVPENERSLLADIAHQAYTPSTILVDSLLIGDRPYAATLTFTAQFLSRSKSKDYTLSWKFNAGLIGRPALGEEVQRTVHRWTDNPKPMGWKYELNPGFVLDVGFGVTKTFFTRTRWFRLELSDFVTVGTLTNEMLVQGGLKIGYLANRRQFYLYYNPGVRLVAYDGTLQGVFFSVPAAAEISASSIEHLVSEQEVGICLRYNRFFLGGYVHYQSRLFRYALNHVWGGIIVGYHFWDNWEKLSGRER